MADRPEVKVHGLGMENLTPEQEAEYERFKAVVSDPRFMDLVTEAAVKISELSGAVMDPLVDQLMPDRKAGVVEGQPMGERNPEAFVGMQVYQEFHNAVLVRMTAAAVAAALTDIRPEMLQQMLMTRVQGTAHNLYVTAGQMLEDTVSPEVVARWARMVAEAVQIQGTVQVVVTRGKMIGGGDRLFYDVSGRDTSPEALEEQRAGYAQAGLECPPQGAADLGLDFTEWGEWAQMDVVNETGEELSPTVLAALVFYEMTWHGFPEEIRERLVDLEDSVDALVREIDEQPASGSALPGDGPRAN